MTSSRLAKLPFVGAVAREPLEEAGGTPGSGGAGSALRPIIAPLAMRLLMVSN